MRPKKNFKIWETLKKSKLIHANMKIRISTICDCIGMQQILHHVMLFAVKSMLQHEITTTKNLFHDLSDFVANLMWSNRM